MVRVGCPLSKELCSRNWLSHRRITGYYGVLAGTAATTGNDHDFLGGRARGACRKDWPSPVFVNHALPCKSAGRRFQEQTTRRDVTRGKPKR